jgi:hypothetical protein
VQRTARRGPNDSEQRDEPPKAPPRSHISLKPAAIVLGLAAVILIAFSVGGALDHQNPGPKVPAGSVPVAGTSLRAEAAHGALNPIIANGQPPVNVIAAVRIPVGWSRLGSADNADGGLYDQQATFSVATSQSQLIDFYRVEMARLGWRIVTTGPATRQPGYAVVGEIAGDDGWYWELGAIVAPSSFSSSGTADRTSFTLRLFQVSDSD